MSTEQDAFLSSTDVDNYVKVLRKSKLKDIGTKSWWDLQDKQQKLSHQALREVEKGLVETIKISLLKHEKIPILVHEAICISMWREQILPQLADLAEEDSIKNFLVYMVLYHETSAVTIMEAVLYHSEACKELGDCVIDLIDYCAATITSLFTRDQSVKTKSTVASQIKEQEQSLSFGVGIRCIAIIQYIAEHMDSLHLSAITRLYQTHDFPMLLSHLIDTSPWTKCGEGNKVLRYSDGVWQEAVEGCPIGRPEAHAWLAMHQLLLFPELGKYYHMTEFARGQLMKLDGKISDWLLRQLPPLHQLRQGLLQLSRFQLPSQRQSIILEIIPEIMNELLLEQTKGSWNEIIEYHSKLLITCPSSEAAKVAERLCKTLCAAASNTNMCVFCSRPAKSRCSRCKAAWYCGRQCQVSHFPHHKKSCISTTLGTAS